MTSYKKMKKILLDHARLGWEADFTDEEVSVIWENWFEAEEQGEAAHIMAAFPILARKLLVKRFEQYPD